MVWPYSLSVADMMIIAWVIVIIIGIWEAGR